MAFGILANAARDIYKVGHGGFLGALLTLTPDPLYSWYAGRTELW